MEPFLMTEAVGNGGQSSYDSGGNMTGGPPVRETH